MEEMECSFNFQADVLGCPPWQTGAQLFGCQNGWGKQTLSLDLPPAMTALGVVPKYYIWEIESRFRRLFYPNDYLLDSTFRSYGRRANSTKLCTYKFQLTRGGVWPAPH